jgi:hypothetical protein
MKKADLKETFYCDFNHQVIKKLAKKFAGEDMNSQK